MTDMAFDYEKLKLFYLGKELSDQSQELPLLYKNKDLTTHAAILGMTGSGKTGLAISLIEEAAIDNIPSIIIDPKGDMGNLLLTFPNLSKEDFEPWIDEIEASNANLTKMQVAQQKAELWENGLKKDYQDKKRIEKLKNSANFTIYTPGSNAGETISILSSFKAPTKDILDDTDTLNQLISSTVASLLSLVGIKENISSKEHILLSSIFMNYFSLGKDLSLEQIISLIVTTPFEKIGVFDLETFFPKEQRLDLALKLNAIIANPSFSTWLEGEKLDISNLLYDEKGKAKVSIFSISHLNDAQRMFFVSLLLNQMVAWMRNQEGTSSLKTLLYMDEIAGYFPPSKNPPSKQPMLTLLKQARAFGVGVVLSTQNPVDLDYKALSNIGTWFIGRLQTMQDKQKVIEGLITTNNNFDKEELLKLMSNLKKREFILKNVHEDGLKLMKTRWALSFLKGPLTKDDIKKLKKPKEEKKQKSEEKNISSKKFTNESVTTLKPLVPNELEQFYNYQAQRDNYQLQPYLLTSCEVNFFDKTKNIDLKKQILEKIYIDETDKIINWEDKEILSNLNFSKEEKINSSYYNIPPFLQNLKNLKQIEKEFTNIIYQTCKLELFYIKELNLYSKQEENLQNYKIRVTDRLNEIIDKELEKLQLKYKKDGQKLEDKLKTLQLKLQKEENDLTEQTTNSVISIATSILGAFLGNKVLSKTNLSKASNGVKSASKVLKENNDVKLAKEQIKTLTNEIEILKSELEEEIENLNTKYKLSNYEIETKKINLRRKDILNVKLSILWEDI